MRVKVTLLAIAVSCVVAVGFRLIRSSETADRVGPTLGIKELVKSLRDELEQLDDERSRDERAPLFRVGNAEIEVSFVVKREAGAEGKVELQVVTVGGTEKWSQEQVQNIKLNLLTTPTRKDQSAPEEPSKALDKSQ